jgi:hypothetical protein
MGVFRRRSEGGAGEQRLLWRLVTAAPGGRGSPSVPSRGTALNGWTRRGLRAAKAARIRAGEHRSFRARKDTAQGPKIAAVERREARLRPRRRRASPAVSGGFAGRPGCRASTPRFPALRSLLGSRVGTTAYPAPQRIRAAQRWLNLQCRPRAGGDPVNADASVMTGGPLERV